MGGLAVLLLLGFYLWGAYKIVRLAKPRWAKALVILVVILIPTADAVYGRIKLRQMCEAEGGLKVYKVMEGVEGFDNPKDEPLEQWLRINGFKFIEGIDRSGKPSRMSLRADGTIALELGVAPISKYFYEDTHGNSDDIFYRIEKTIRVRNTDEVLSRAVNFSYAGGWVERFVDSLYAARGTAGRCGPDVLITELVTKTLKPIK